MKIRKSFFGRLFNQNVLHNTFSGWQGILLLLALSVITYLPHITQFNFYRDDWYYIVDGFSGGKGIFHTMFAIDRPARGYLFEWLFQWFGTHPLPYHISAFFWRLLSGIAALVLFRVLWPKQRQAAFWMALLFTIYPGYLWWISAVEYQPMIISVFFQVLSILFMLYALKVTQHWQKIGFAIVSILSGWIYIFFVDYAAGMEAFRYFCVFVLLSHEEGTQQCLKLTVQVFQKAWAYLLISAGFLFWNIFLFQNQRGETDIIGHINHLFSNPLNTSAHWFVNFFKSVMNTAFFAWVVPFNEQYFALPFRKIAIGFMVAFFVLVCIVLSGLLFSRKEKDEILQEKEFKWQKEAFWVGLLGVIFGVLPIIIANRAATFHAYSHYMLPASLAASMMVVGLISMIKQPEFRFGFLMCVVIMSILTHYSLAELTLTEEQKVQKFWLQMAWRANSMDEGTTLLVQFPGFTQGEEKDIVWGPANLIFAPGYDHSHPVKYPITAVPINYQTTKIILSEDSEIWNFRSHSGKLDYSKLLVISQPTTSSCVHVMDARWPRLTKEDSDQMLVLSYYSNIDTLKFDGSFPEPPAHIFGKEPAHEWCYYYEKAEIAFQQGNWQEVLSIAEEAAALNYRPNDRVEWMPFLQAAALAGEEDKMRGYASMINEDHYLQRNACFTLRAMNKGEFALSPTIQEVSEELFCHGY